MLITTAPAFGIRLIDTVSQDNEGVRISFRDGPQARLERGHANFEHLLWLAQWSLSPRPVGFITDAAGRIIDLNPAHDTTVAWVRGFAMDPSRFRVAFWAYSPICALTQEHPEFDRILANLAAAAGTPQQLWVATYSEETVEEQDEEGLIAALPKIMDVRPLSSLPSSNGDPGGTEALPGQRTS
jgi:hypothetical protein